MRKLILGRLNILIVLFISVFYVNAASINSVYEQGHHSYSSVDIKIAEKLNSPTSQNLKTTTTAGQFLGEKNIFCRGMERAATKGEVTLYIRV